MGSFFAGGAMQNVCNFLQGGVHDRAIRDTSLDYLQPIRGRQKPFMT
jgi:hypothetical protein